MKATNRSMLALLAVSGLTWMIAATHSLGADLSEADQKFLNDYEKIRAALVEDNLGSAKKAAFTLGDAGVEIAKCSSLEEARAAFSKLSDTAEKLAAGHTGYYVMHCPMVNKDWVQTTPAVANPYGGKEMVRCGEVKK